MQIATIDGQVIEVEELRDNSSCRHLSGVTLNACSDFTLYECDACGKSLTVDQVKCIYETPEGQE